MTPAVQVVEIASGAADVSLAACDGVHVRRGAFIVTRPLHDWLTQRTKGREHWHAPRSLRRLEDVRSVVLLRSPESCEVVLSDRARGLLPLAWRRRARVGLRVWRMDADRFCVAGRVAACIAPRDHRVLPVPFSGRPPLRLYHHGRLEMFVGWRSPRARSVTVGDAVRLHLEGPGDEARFRFRASRAGSLIVERTPGHMPNVDMLIGADEKTLEPRGMMSVSAGGEVLVVFRHSGPEPIELDVGFLFTPDPTLTCVASMTPMGDGLVRAAVTIRNAGGAPVSMTRPSAGTVEWFAGDTLVAAARPASLPDAVLLAPGRMVGYEAIFSLPGNRWPTMARVDAGPDTGVLHCPLKTGTEVQVQGTR